MTVHIIHKQFTFVFGSICILVCLTLLPKAALAQPATHDFVTLTGGSTPIPDYVIFPFAPLSPNKGGLGFAKSGTLPQFVITDDSRASSLTIGLSGVGIGLTDSRTDQILAPLHIKGGKPGDTFNSATLFIEDRNTMGEFRDLIVMQNNGGIGIDMADLSQGGGTNFSLVVSNHEFGINGVAASPFAISDTAPSNSLRLTTAGVGLGTVSPASRLHVFADGTTYNTSTISSEVTAGAGTQNRTMLNLVNSGGAFMTFTDTSLSSTWFFSNSNDELLLKKSGNGSPGIRILPAGEFRFVNANANSFTILANGDVKPKGTYLNSSDRNLKENFHAVDTNDVLNKVASLPITTWNYIHDAEDTPHMGPMAQDFYTSFNLGNDDKSIATIDEDGIALAAIQGLNHKVEAENQSLRKTIVEQAELIAELTQRMERLESRVTAAAR